jgi:hypothetical protein
LYYRRRVEREELPLSTRIWFAWACFFRILVDGRFAGRAWSVRAALPEAEKGPGAEAEPTEASSPRSSGPSEEEIAARVEKAVAKREESLKKAHASGLADARSEGAVLLLSLLQTEGRLVDFLRQDVASFDDAEVGAAARVVHDGCRKALDAHVSLEPVRAEAEGKPTAVSADEAKQTSVKLTGDVRGEAPFAGTLKHKGWRAASVRLPTPTVGWDTTLICPAEIEL